MANTAIRGLGMLVQSTIGKKVLMAGSGLLMVGWLFLHMVGNLLIFQGPKAINDYGWFLQEGSHGLIWVNRVVMLTAVVVHIWAAASLTATNHQARDTRYHVHKKTRTTGAALTMRWGGAALLAFLVYHLAHLTVGVAHPSFEHGEVYHNMVSGFSVPWVSAIYMVAMIALGMHLYHGIWSGLQTLGINHPPLNDARKWLAAGVAGVIVTGNLSMPIAVLTGFLELQP